MHLGISTYTYPWLMKYALDKGKPFTALMILFEKAIKHQIYFAQIGDNVPLHQLSKEELSSLITKASVNNIRLELGTKRLCVDHIRKYISLANELGCDFLRVVIDDTNFHPDTNSIIKNIRELLPFLIEAKLMLAIENHDRFSATELEQIIIATDPIYVGICLDTANSLGAGEGINEVLRILAPYTINLHIKDFNIQRVQHKMGFDISGCSAGEGMLDISMLIQQIKQQGKCKTAILEIWSNPKESHQDSVTQEELWANKSIQYLKKYIN